MSIEKPKVGIVLATNEAYAMPTCVTLCSVLENNRKALPERQVDVVAYIYADHWTDHSLYCIKELAQKYNCPIEIKDPSNIYTLLSNVIENDTYAGTFAAEVRLFAPLEIDVDYNLICLDSDVAMISGSDLYELATLDLNQFNASCASTIDMQSSRMIKSVANMGKNIHIYNIDGIFLVNSKLYRQHKVDELLRKESKRVAYALNPYWMMVRNGYVLRDEIVPLPMKYQVYPPMKGLIKEKDWMFIFGLKYEEYYSHEQIREALDNTVFVHYINWIFRKPWNSYPYVKEPIPFHDEWDKYQSLTLYKIEKKPVHIASFQEKFRYYIFRYFYKPYVLMCGIFYRKEVRKRNKIVKERARETGVVF